MTPRARPRLMLTDHPAPFDLFQWLPKGASAAFEQAAQIRRYDEGETIYSQGDPGEHVYRLLSGSVRISVAKADGRELLYLLLEPGDCFGASSCIDGEPRPHTAQAGEDVQIQVLGRKAFERLRAADRSFDDALLRLANKHMRLLSGFLADAYLKSLKARTASRLVAATSSFGIATENGIKLAVRLSQSELALMVGCSRQSVNRILQEFHANGLIQIGYGTLVIRDLPRLRKRATNP